MPIFIGTPWARFLGESKSASQYLPRRWRLWLRAAMPLIDKPLAELERYLGRNPQPEDFDAYWERAVNQLDDIDPELEMVPVDPLGSNQAECFDLTFTGAGGARVYAKYLRPRNRRGRCPAVLMFHGYTMNSGAWVDKLAYVAEGFCVAALDVRGQGGRSEDVGGVKGNTHRGHIVRGLDDHEDKLLFRDIYLDTVRLARLVMALPEVDAERVAATGASQGGGLTLACAALEPRVAMAAPVYPFLCDYLRVWEMDLAKGAYQELTDWFRMFDPRHEREGEMFRRLGYIDNQFLAPRIRAEVLMGVGLMDTICPPSTQFAAYNRITSPKQKLVYPDYGHEELPGLRDAIFAFLMRLRS